MAEFLREAVGETFSGSRCCCCCCCGCKLVLLPPLLLLLFCVLSELVLTKGRERRGGIGGGVAFT